MKPTLRVSIDDKRRPNWIETDAEEERYEAVMARALELEYTGMACGWYTAPVPASLRQARGQFVVSRGVERILVEAETPMAAVEIMGTILDRMQS